jgi:hypothetical protein
MKKGGVGGAKTQKAGETFENETLDKLIKSFGANGYEIQSTRPGGLSPRGITLSNSQENIVDLYFKAALHKDFFEPRGVKSIDYFSARLEPDTAVYSHKAKTLTIIEKKQQTGAGSVAEKLQTCDYKMLYYSTLCKPLRINVHLFWQLGPYFVENQNGLRSVFEYMESKGSRYFFHEIPFREFVI